MIIVVTGGSKGFGKSIAEKFAGDKQGHTLMLCARNKEKLDEEAKRLQGRFPRATVSSFACDLANREELNEFAKWILNENSAPDVLVNNAGTFIPGSVYNEPEGALETIMQLNLFSVYHLTRSLLPKMMERKSGHIFNICSIAGLKAYNNGGAYSISKHALAGFSRNLREEMKPHGIKVTTVYPGAAWTDSWAGSGIDPKRMMESKDIAEMIYAAAHLSPQACVEDIILRPQLGDLP